MGDRDKMNGQSNEMPLSAPQRAVAERTDEAVSTPEGATPAIEIRDLDFYYGDLQAVSGVNLGFEKNEVTALIGP